MMITTIILDFVGVLVKENEFPLSATQQRLESEFGKQGRNTKEQYLDWATRATDLTRNELEQQLTIICENIYELRDNNIFDQFGHYKLGLATNHLPYVYTWLKKHNLIQRFAFILTSSDCEFEKPDQLFYKELIKLSNEMPQNILFVDDSIKNVEAARRSGMYALHYNRQEILSESIQEAIDSVEQGS